MRLRASAAGDKSKRQQASYTRRHGLLFFLATIVAFWFALVYFLFPEARQSQRDSYSSGHVRKVADVSTKVRDIDVSLRFFANAALFMWQPVRSADTPLLLLSAEAVVHASPPSARRSAETGRKAGLRPALGAGSRFHAPVCVAPPPPHFDPVINRC